MMMNSLHAMLSSNAPLSNHPPNPNHPLSPTLHAKRRNTRRKYPNRTKPLRKLLRSSSSDVFHLSGLGGEPKPWWRSALEDNELRLEEDITIDRESNTGVCLNTTEAPGGADGSVVHVATGNNSAVRTEAKSD